MGASLTGIRPSTTGSTLATAIATMAQDADLTWTADRHGGDQQQSARRKLHGVSIYLWAGSENPNKLTRVTFGSTRRRNAKRTRSVSQELRHAAEIAAAETDTSTKLRLALLHRVRPLSGLRRQRPHEKFDRITRTSNRPCNRKP